MKCPCSASASSLLYVVVFGDLISGGYYTDSSFLTCHMLFVPDIFLLGPCLSFHMIECVCVHEYANGMSQTLNQELSILRMEYLD